MLLVVLDTCAVEAHLFIINDTCNSKLTVCKQITVTFILIILIHSYYINPELMPC